MNRHDLSGIRIGAWEIRDLIGRGGMGEVYRANRIEGSFQQEAAIKIIRADLMSDISRRRFEMEQEHLAALNYPNIARLFSAGTLDDGRPYLVMELVHGKPIDVYANERALSLDDRVRVFLKVCAAVQHAHKNLVIHLDLKPANILVTTEGEPKLVDFGIGRRIEPRREAAAHEADAFSSPYASPEQVTPGRALTTSSDVYSLGALLYELVAGQLPFDPAEAEQELLRRIRDEMPRKPSDRVPESRRIRTPRGQVMVLSPRAIAEVRCCSPRELHKKLKGKLDNIVLVALRKEEERRYPSVEEFARDINRYLDGKPVHARPEAAVYTAVRATRRRPVWIAAGVMIALNLWLGEAIPREMWSAALRDRSNTAHLLGALRPAATAIKTTILPWMQAAGLDKRKEEALLRAFDAVDESQ